MVAVGSVVRRILKHSTPTDKAFWALALALAVVVLAHHGRNRQGRREGFESSKEFSVKRGPDIFDEFYVSVYDDLLYSELKNNYELGQIVNAAGPTEQSRILDVGSGTGHHVALLADRGHDVVGLDVSPAMVSKARDTYPGLRFIEGNLLDGMAFEPSSFTTITCMYFTIYYVRDKRRFFSNCMKWLMPGGRLVLHLVDRHRFDPIIPAGDPLMIVSAQTHAKERITTSVVEFDTHEYKSKFNMSSGDTASLDETFRNKTTGAVRKNEHRLYMTPQKEILAEAKGAGFILISQTDMALCQYEHQYIYVLQKPS